MEKISRRTFLRLITPILSITGLAALLAPIVIFFYPPKLEEMPAEAVAVGPSDSLPVGEAKLVRFGRYPAIVIHTPDGLRAFSAVCTHFACVVKWDPELGQIICPCHDGFFNPSDGAVISGPPPTPLEPLKIEIRDNHIFVGGGE